MNPHNRCPDLSRVLPVETVHVIRPEMISPLAREQSERFRQTQNKALESNATTRVQSSISSAKITDVEDEEIGEEADEENISSLVLPSLSSVLGPLARRPSKTPTSGIQSPTFLRSSAVPYLIDDSARWGCPICGKDFASRNYTAQHLESACQTVKVFRCPFEDCSYRSSLRTTVVQHCKSKVNHDTVIGLADALYSPL